MFPAFFWHLKLIKGTCPWCGLVPGVMENGLDYLDIPVVSQTFMVPLKMFFSLQLSNTEMSLISVPPFCSEGRIDPSWELTAPVVLLPPCSSNSGTSS